MRHSNKFFRFFPPPEFFKMPAVGLEIANTAIRFVELLNKGGSIVLGAYGERKLKKGIVQSGEIIDDRALEEELSLLRRKHKLTFVRALLPEQKGYIFTAMLPRVLKKEIRGSIALRLEEHVPIPPDQAIFDYDISPCMDEQKKDFWDASVGVMSSELVGRYWGILSSSGLWPLSFELEAYALARSLIKQGDCGTHMIVDIGRTRTGIVIVSGGIVRFTATIPLGGDNLTQATSRAIGVAEDQAASIKEKYGLTRRHGKGELFSVLTPIVSTLRDEILKYVDFWNTHHEESEGRSIQNIILCGGESNVPGVKDYFSGNLKTNVLLGNSWVNITSSQSYIPEIGRADSLRYATAIGLALGGF